MQRRISPNTPLRPSPAVIQNCSSSLFVENKTKKPAPAVIQNCSSSSNFFTKCTVAFQKWKATVHFVKIKKPISFSSDPTLQLIFLPIFFSLSSHFFRKFLSLLLICSLFSLLSLLFRKLPIFFFFFSQIYTARAPHHRPQETHPTAMPWRRYPPRWPRREGENHPTAKPAAKPCRARSQRSRGHPSVPISAWTRETHPTAKPAAKPCRARSQWSGGHPSLPISAWPVPAVPMNSNLQRKGHRKWSSAWRWWSRAVWWLRKFWLLKLIWNN